MEKCICIACKDEFVPRSPYQQYCHDCSRAPEKASALHRWRQKEYSDILGENQSTYTCKQCGRTWNSIYYNEFCSKTCRRTYLDNHIICATCGRNLAELNAHFDKFPRKAVFCSNDCQETYQWKVAREKGWVKKCLHCGQEFIAKVKMSHGGYVRQQPKFCSQGCWHSYRALHSAKN